MQEKTWRVVAMMGLVLLAACGGSEPGDQDDDDDGDPSGEQHRPGLGSSTKSPEGQRFSLPSGVELAGPINGYSVFEPEKCAPEDEAKGAGTLVRICLPLRNTTNTTSTPVPITLTIPPGFTVISDKLSTQNGILLQRQTVTVEPGRTIHVPMYFFCLNETRSGSSPSDTFQLGPVLEYSDFKELFSLLADKALEPADNHVELQAAVWRLSQGDSLTTADRNYISGL